MFESNGFWTFDHLQFGLFKPAHTWFGKGNPDWVLQEEMSQNIEVSCTRLEKEKVYINCLEWTSQSPDANPIENVKGIMKERLRRNNIHSTK